MWIRHRCKSLIADFKASSWHHLQEPLTVLLLNFNSGMRSSLKQAHRLKMTAKESTRLCERGLATLTDPRKRWMAIRLRIPGSWNGKAPLGLGDNKGKYPYLQRPQAQGKAWTQENVVCSLGLRSCQSKWHLPFSMPSWENRSLCLGLCAHEKGTEFLLCFIGCFKVSYPSMPRKLKPTIHSFTKTQCKLLSMGLPQRPKVTVLIANQARCCNVDSHRFSQGKKALFQQAPLGGVPTAGK